MSSDKTSIEIDFEVYQRIVAAKTTFAESDNDVLRRLLGIDSAKPVVEPQQPVLKGGTQGRAVSEASSRKVQVNSTTAASPGITIKDTHFPEATRIRVKYRGVITEGEVRDGAFHLGGGVFQSPSSAASHVRGGLSTNGWVHMEVLLPGEGRWRLADELRHAVPKPARSVGLKLSLDPPTTWREELLTMLRARWKPGEEFHLTAVYDFELELAARFPANSKVQEKIRATLQLLRDEGIVRFVDRAGTYFLTSS